MIRRAILWASLAILAYVHLLFPALVLARGRLRPRPYREAPITPRVSVIVAAHDEEASIGLRVRNLLALDYPAERLEVVVASDGSTDGTVAVARDVADERVCVLDLPRVGKAVALETAAAAATGEILAFTDANSEWTPSALRALVAPFADPSVGGVAGDQRYRPRSPGRGDEPDGDRPAGPAGLAGASGSAGAAGAADEGERTYWAIDRELKAAEGRAGDAISATGAIYAIRRELMGPLPPDVTDDFYISTGVIAAGRRLVFAPGAVAWEPVASSAGGEFGRKVRIMTRGLRGVVARRDLLDPRQHGFYSLQLLSHKLLRRLAVYPLILAGLTSAALARSDRRYALLAAGQGAVWVLGSMGLALGGRPASRHPLLATPAFVVLVSGASLVASLRAATGRTVTRWEPGR